MDDQDKKQPRGPSLRGAARRVLGGGPGGERPLPRTRELLAGLLDSSDKVKTEAIRAMGREVRTYLEGLGIDDALMYVITNYSLEVNASFRLKPLADSPAAEDEEHQAEEPAAEGADAGGAAGLRDEGVPDPELGAGDEAEAVVDDDGAETEGGEGVDDDVD